MTLLAMNTMCIFSNCGLRGVTNFKRPSIKSVPFSHASSFAVKLFLARYSSSFTLVYNSTI